MKKIHQLGLGLFLLCAFGTSACKKDDMNNQTNNNNTNTAQPCETNRTSTLQVSNNSSSPYNLYINGTYRVQLPANSISTPITVNEGNNIQLRAVQASGYILYATEKAGTYNALRCNAYSWQIP